MGLDTGLYDIDDWYDGKYDSHLEVIEKFLEGSGLTIEDIEDIKRNNDPDNKVSRWEIGKSNYLVAHFSNDDLKKQEITTVFSDDDSISEKIISLREKSEFKDNNSEVTQKNLIVKFSNFQDLPRY